MLDSTCKGAGSGEQGAEDRPVPRCPLPAPHKIEQFTGRMEVQIFGTKKSADTRKALRFFSDRRVKTHFVDLAERAASPGELKRFAQKFGAQALLDRESKRFAELGLRTALYGDERWLQIMADEPMLLRTPLVRWQHKLTIGDAEPDWKRWMEEAK